MKLNRINNRVNAITWAILVILALYGCSLNYPKSKKTCSFDVIRNQKRVRVDLNKELLLQGCNAYSQLDSGLYNFHQTNLIFRSSVINDERRNINVYQLVFVGKSRSDILVLDSLRGGYKVLEVNYDNFDGIYQEMKPLFSSDAYKEFHEKMLRSLRANQISTGVF